MVSVTIGVVFLYGCASLAALAFPWETLLGLTIHRLIFITVGFVMFPDPVHSASKTLFAFVWKIWKMGNKYRLLFLLLSAALATCRFGLAQPVVFGFLVLAWLHVARMRFARLHVAAVVPTAPAIAQKVVPQPILTPPAIPQAVPICNRQDRFSGHIKPVAHGTARARSRAYSRKCGKDSRPIPEDVKAIVRKYRRPQDDCVSAVLRVYTANDLYEKMNKALYTDDEAAFDEYGGLIHALRLAMKARCKKHNVTKGIVYRTLNLDQAQLQQFKPGFKFLWPNFISTSRSPCLNFGKVKVSIDLNGDGLTYALDVSEYSIYPNEQEVLIYPYSGFEVLDYQTQVDGSVLIKLRTVDTTKIDPNVGGCPCGAMPTVS